MENQELINKIKESFNEVNAETHPQALKEAITDIVRSVNRLQTENKDLNLLLRKISTDLMKSYTNQVQYSELRNKSENPGLKVKAEFDANFFKSLAILRTELFQVLEKL